ncbi:AAA family ATPase [bacterium]|nr:AAA family ATPase [bacterium]
MLEPAVSGLGTAKERLEDHERAKPKIPARLEAEREKHEARQSILAGLDRELPRLRAALDDLAKHAELALEARALGEALAEHDTSPARILSTTLLAAAKVIEVAARAAEKVDLECGPSLGSEIAKAFSRLDRPYLELLDKEKGLSAWTKAQNDLKKDVADVEAKAKQLGLARREEAKLLDERKRALGELDHVRSEIGRVREAEVAHVKRAAPKDVRIHLEKDGDRRAYAQALAVLFQNSRVNRQPELVALLVESFSPRALVAVMEADGGGAQLDKLTGRNDGAKVAGWLTGRDGFHDLEALGLDDRLDIGLVQDGIEKPIEKLSNGQRAIALLPLILRPGTIPIVFDQPEDDVDNTYMVEIARRLRQLKRGRQIIIVTHDANLVVLGDADRVIVMSMESSKRAVVAKTGTVNDCRDEILLLLEGGEEAFRARAESYDMGDSLDPDGSTEEDEEEADSKDSRR